MTTDYQKQGIDFLEKTGTTFKAEKIGHFPYFEDDKESRDVYQVTLTRNGKTYSFRFGQSIAHSKPYIDKQRDEFTRRDDRFTNRIEAAKKYPYVELSAYDVLAAVTKSEPGTFSDFCSDFGYDTNSRKAEKTYFAVQEEYKNTHRLFADVMDELNEIN
jgi:hypothetical protein